MSKIMKNFNFKKISTLEIIVFIIFVFYLVFQVQTPTFLMPYLSSPFGIVFVLIVTLCVFFYTNPVLGVLALFVAYELIRRSTIVTGKVVTVKYTPTQIRKDLDMVALNPPKEVTLEEDIVATMAPLGVSEQSAYLMTSFKPAAENIHNASPI
jgi:hypothetical protein